MLQDEIKHLTQALNADFFGVSDLSPGYDVILEQDGPVIAGFPRAISIGIALMHAIVDQLPQRIADPAGAMNYSQHAYTIVNQRLDHLASQVGNVLQRAGYRALPIPSSQTVDKERQRGAFSHKLAAHLAGLGWIGRNCLLITPEVGPRVRWATILTDAPLTPTGTPMDQRCGNCRQCVDACPAQAFTSEPYRDGEPREARFDFHKCQAYFDEMSATIGVGICGMCLYVCPYGKSGSQSSVVVVRHCRRQNDATTNTQTGPNPQTPRHLDGDSQYCRRADSAPGDARAIPRCGRRGRR